MSSFIREVDSTDSLGTGLTASSVSSRYMNNFLNSNQENFDYNIQGFNKSPTHLITVEQSE